MDYQARGDRLYVITDSIPFLLKIFSLEGHYIGGFGLGDTRELARFFASRTLAVNSKGDVFFSQPRNDQLLTVYDAHGRELRGIGEKVAGRDAYGELCDSQPRCRDRRYQTYRRSAPC